MWTMLAAPTFPLTERFQRIELVIVVGIFDTIDSTFVFLPLIDDDIKTVERPQQSLCFSDIDLDRFDTEFAGSVDSRWGDAEQATILITHNQPTFGISTHADPGTFLIFWNRVKQLGLEAFSHNEPILGSRFRLFERSRCKKSIECDFPRFATNFPDDLGILPMFGSFEVEVSPTFGWLRGSLPGFVRNNRPGISPARFEIQRDKEPGCGRSVCSFYGQNMFSTRSVLFDELGDIGKHRLVPGSAFDDFFPVEKNCHLVIAGGIKTSRCDRSFHTKLFAKVNLLGRLTPFGFPDPIWLGVLRTCF